MSPTNNEGLVLLDSCPFCGAKAHVTMKAGRYRIECTKRFDGCHMNMRTHHKGTIEAAAADWNNRTHKKD